jgi:hypothetical protein
MADRQRCGNPNCAATILPSTGEKTGGLCMPCFRDSNAPDTIATLRWAAVPMVCMGAFCAVAYGWYLLNKWCPWGELVSGWCFMPQWLDTTILSIAAAIASALVLVLGVLVAPSDRSYVSWIIFALGATLALIMALAVRIVVPAATAISTGLGVAMWLAKQFRK